MDINTIKSILTIILTLLQRSGYVLIHIGCIPTTNINQIFLHYLFNIAATTIVFIVFGSNIAMDEHWKGLFNVDINKNYNTLNYWSYFIQSSSIVQLVTAGRIHLIGELITTLLFSGILFPLIVQGMWSKTGWMTVKTISILPYIDISGGSIINIFGASFALGAMIIFGGRVINVNRLDPSSLIINSLTISILGYFILILNTIGLIIQSPFINENQQESTNINIILSISVGLIIGTLSYYPFKKENYWKIIWVMQSGLSSLITVSTGVCYYDIILTSFYSAVGVIIYILISEIIKRTDLEDYCNIISVNLTNGFLSSILVTFHKEILKLNGNEIFKIFIWQSFCSTLLFLIGIISSLFLFTILKYTKILRNSDEKALKEENKSLEHNESLINNCEQDDVLKPGIQGIKNYIRIKMKTIMNQNPTENEDQFQNTFLVPI